jgi:pimeloyl-ACP methyl ester carboxylesterase
MAKNVTVVLVHGAFADASSWNGVIEILLAKGLNVRAPANPLRGLHYDSAYIAGYLKQIDGPIVLAGHSYGGAVVSSAAANAENVIALVYVSAFIPEKDEVLGKASENSKDSILAAALRPLKYPLGDGAKTATEFIIAPEKVHEAFAGDLTEDQAAIIGAIQRPISEACFSDPAGEPAWKKIPSWAVVAKGDKAIGADVVRSYAKKSGAKTTELDGSHVIMISQPEKVAGVIMEAINSLP